MTWLTAFVFLLGAWGNASAHQINSSYTTVITRPDTVKVMFAVDEADLIRYFGLDRNGDGYVWREEGLEGAAAVGDRLVAGTDLEVDGRPAVLRATGAEVGQDRDGNLFLYLYFCTPVRSLPRTLDLGLRFITELGEQHKNLAKILIPDKPLIQAVFSREEPRHHFVVSEPADLWAQIGDFLLLGVQHIFLGYDHICFLLALIIVGGRLGNLVKIVTAFTVAHSITLILAALQVVELPGRLVESGIALSIVYVALENFWLHRTDYRWVLSFVFGLIHGFGFASVLRELGLPTEGLIASLLAFNVGVEAGQLVIVSLMYPLTVLAARSVYRRQLVWGVSGVILLFGLGWLVERVFSLQFMPI
ncbi:MAG: HupE/UreJ family protein [Candidatus Latescibacteria bacterium]|nr:HupE/UreJ family protein [Candidatus Latescibacterota bacterium]